MLFSSNTFLFGFLPITVLAYYLSPRKFRNLLLLLASLVFYGWGEPRFLPLMLVSILLNYGCGRAVAARQAAGKDPKAALWAGVALNLAMLGFFKYGRFFFGSRFPDIPLPIGISFYIFQAMSYVIDVSREQVQVQKNVLTFGTYVALFPQLIAGPIVRYRDVARELEDRRESGAQFAAGVLRFTLGLSKKVLLANTFGSAWNVLREGAGMTSGWIGLMCYTLQIYFDFSGYSDMAIGLGLLFGFTFLENFNYPYISQSVTEFWRRWHISLSSWFREYVYIPLGGNRRGKKRQILNILIVWLLTGLWHGANYTFIIWGLFFGIILILEKYLFKNFVKKHHILSCIITDILVIIGFVFFYAKDLPSAFLTIKGMLGLNNLLLINSEVIFYIKNYILILIISIAVSLNIFKIFKGKLQNIAFIYYLALLILSTAYIVDSSFNPFLYFRF